ncbi:MAG: OB-fold domain-containing protein, partial [Dehalococcoidia bacterium]
IATRMGAQLVALAYQHRQGRFVQIDDLRATLDNEMEWRELKGKGRLEAFTCTAVGPPFMAEKGYSAQNPYCVGVVKLEEGAQVVALIDGVDGNQPESIRRGLPFEVSFVEMGKDASGGAFLVFRPA